MARERLTASSQEDGVEGTQEDQGENSRKKEKRKKKKVKDGSKAKRPKFCPNSSKSFNMSRTFHQQRHISVSALKKNNQELARALNTHKSIIATMKAEKIQRDREVMDMREELAILKTNGDLAAVEAEVQKRLSEVLGPVKRTMDRAIDNMVGLSDNLTQGLSLVSAPLRQSTAAPSGSRNSSLGPCFQMRPAGGRSLPGSSSPPKGPAVSKVTPMVAGHAISRPRIQLTQMDAAAMTAAMDRQQLVRQEEVVNEGEGVIEESEEETEEGGNSADEIDATPPPPVHPGRSIFNLTNIGEESRLDESRMEESRLEQNIMEESEVIEEEPSPVPVEEERPALSPVIVRRVSSAAPSFRNVTTPTSSDGSGVRSQSSRLSSRGSMSSSRSPQVDILRTQRHVAVTLSPLPLGETPQLPSPTPARSSSVGLLGEDFPEDPSESFLEGLCDDGGEGPSWLFDTSHEKKQKRRSSAVRKLSAVWSEGGRSSGRGASSGSGLDSSDITLGQESEDSEVSGYVLDRDLVEQGTADPDISPTIARLMSTGGSPSSSLEVSHLATSSTEMMDLATSCQVLNSSDQENRPVSGFRNPTEDLGIAVSSETCRTPLREMPGEGGGVVRYNPKLDTGVTVAALKQARIQLSNVGAKHKLTECYISISPGRSLSLDQVFNLGLQAGLHSPLSASRLGRRKRKLRSEGGIYPPRKKSISTRSINPSSPTTRTFNLTSPATRSLNISSPTTSTVNNQSITSSVTSRSLASENGETTTESTVEITAETGESDDDSEVNKVSTAAPKENTEVIEEIVQHQETCPDSIETTNDLEPTTENYETPVAITEATSNVDVVEKEISEPLFVEPVDDDVQQASTSRKSATGSSRSARARSQVNYAAILETPPQLKSRTRKTGGGKFKKSSVEPSNDSQKPPKESLTTEPKTLVDKKSKISDKSKKSSGKVMPQPKKSSVEQSKDSVKPPKDSLPEAPSSDVETGRSRRRAASGTVSYKEKTLNTKMRRS